MWGQAVTRLCEREGLSVTTACKLFGHCRQAYYQLKHLEEEKLRKENRIITSVKEIRELDPRIGSVKLWLMMKDLYPEDWAPGRDAFRELLKRKKLLNKPPKPRRTTNSNHRFHKWKNLIKDFVPTGPNQLWVSDITYIDLEGGKCCYLHLVTDAYSHMIVGWCLAPTLEAIFTLKALRMAIASTGKDSLTGLIHHSDRGIQYCCDLYIHELQAYNIKISMTEDYNPTDNGIAERVNGTIKTEHVYVQEHRFKDVEEAREKIGTFINFYNIQRPHMSIGMQTPAQAHMQHGEQKKYWKNKNKRKNETTSQINI